MAEGVDIEEEDLDLDDQTEFTPITKKHSLCRRN